MSVNFTGTYSQTFDTLPTSGTSLAWSNDSTLSGWSLFRQPAPGTVITAINANSGSSNTGTFHSFGVAGTNPLADRALGGVASGGAYFGSPTIGAVAGWMAVALTNGTVSTINTIDLNYTGEQWRDGGNTTAQTMTLEYGFGSTFASISTWTAAPGSGFNFTSPIHTATAASLDGNVASNRTTDLGGTLFNLSWTAGSTLWVRWSENNDAGNDHGLAIDDVSINVNVVSESLIVDTLVDELDANHSAGDLSLREAITLANGSFGANTISFADSLTSGGPTTILLTKGELKITDIVAINGPAANLLTIDASGNDPTPEVDNLDGSRIFSVGDGISGNYIDVSINGLTLTGGDAEQAIGTGENLAVNSSNISGNNGAGISGAVGTLSVNASIITGNSGGGIVFDQGTVTVTGSTISDNFDNGGIYANGSQVIVTGSTIRGNAASIGGGINIVGSLTVSDSTISGNLSTLGGGIYSRASTVTLTNSTVNGNSAHRGGGIFSNESTVTLINSTISGNSAAQRGGGIYCYRGGYLTAAYSTITSNDSDFRFFDSSGGGIYVHDSSVAELDHTIVAGNFSRDIFFPTNSSKDDIHGTVSARCSLIGYTYDATIADNGGNLIGTSESYLDPLLGPLADNGGPTMTHALLPGSPAIDAGDLAIVLNLHEFDQRGEPYLRVHDGDGIGTSRIDMGALELQPIIPPPALAGDYNLDFTVDALDYTVWRNSLGTAGLAPFHGADGSGNRSIGPEDYDVWKLHYGESLPMDPGGGGLAQQVARSEQDLSSELLADATTVDLQPTVPRLGFFGRIQPVRSGLREVAELDRTPATTDHDESLLAWLSDRATRHESPRIDGETMATASERDKLEADEIADIAFEVIGANL